MFSPEPEVLPDEEPVTIFEVTRSLDFTFVLVLVLVLLPEDELLDEVVVLFDEPEEELLFGLAYLFVTSCVPSEAYVS